MTKAVIYYRVSTDRQGESGLGLDAQESAVRDFVATHNYNVIAEYIEIESGRKSHRPLLKEGLRVCKRHGAVLLIAKLDRLSRSVAFITTLLEAGVKVKAIDYPEADKVILQFLAVFAEFERDQISQRTAAALKAAKERGVVLGRFGKETLSKRNKEGAIDFAWQMKPIIEGMQQDNIKSVRRIAQELNRQQIPTYRNAGQKWHPSHVHQLIKRIDNETNTNYATNKIIDHCSSGIDLLLLPKGEQTGTNTGTDHR